MRNFEYCSPTRILFGKDAHMNIGEVISGYGFKKVFLHYGTGSVKKSGLYGQVTSSLNEHGVSFVELGGVEPNPKLSLAQKGVEMCRKEGCDLVLAVGGGSVIDSAKMIALGAKVDFNPWDFSLKKAFPSSALPIGVILTLAASGSEMSTSCVITNEDGWLKRGFASELMRPLFSVMNPELTFSVNKYQTACGVVDIMMHTIERYFYDAVPADLTDRLAEGLLKSVVDAGKAVIGNLTDYDARATLMLAGSFAHNGLTSLGRNLFLPCHQIEHELSGMYDYISHGAGLSALWPAWAKYVYKQDVERFCNYAVRVWNIEPDFEQPEKTALAGIIATEEYFKSLGMPVRITEFEFAGEIKTEEMAEKCTFWGKRKLASPIELGKKEIMEIFELAM